MTLNHHHRIRPYLVPALLLATATLSAAIIYKNAGMWGRPDLAVAIAEGTLACGAACALTMLFVRIAFSGSWRQALFGDAPLAAAAALRQDPAAKIEPIIGPLLDARGLMMILPPSLQGAMSAFTVGLVGALVASKIPAGSSLATVGGLVTTGVLVAAFVTLCSVASFYETRSASGSQILAAQSLQKAATETGLRIPEFDTTKAEALFGRSYYQVYVAVATNVLIGRILDTKS